MYLSQSKERCQAFNVTRLVHSQQAGRNPYQISLMCVVTWRTGSTPSNERPFHQVI